MKITDKVYTFVMGLVTGVILAIILISSTGCTIITDESEKPVTEEYSTAPEDENFHNCFVVPNNDYWCNSPVNPSRDLYPSNPLSVWGNGGFDE